MFDRLGGYEDVNDADRLGRDPAMELRHRASRAVLDHLVGGANWYSVAGRVLLDF